MTGDAAPTSEQRAEPRGSGRTTRRRKLVIAALVGVILISLQQLASRIDPKSDIAGILVLATVLYLAPFAFIGVRFLWRKATYRVGVRLFLSYLLIGLVPFPLLALLAVVPGYMLVGQYGAVRVGHEIGAVESRLDAVAADAARELAAQGPDAALQVLRVARARSAAAGVTIEWLLADGAREWRSDGASARVMPHWAEEGAWHGPVVHGDTASLAAIERRGPRLVVALMPLDIANGRAISRAQCFDTRFLVSRRLLDPASNQDKRGGVNVVIGGKDGNASQVRVAGERVPETQVERGWGLARSAGGDRWKRLTVTWMRFFPTARNWDDGAEAATWSVLAIVKVSVGGAADDFFASPRPLSGELRTALLVTGSLFGIMYLIVVAVAALMILAITRATARLSRGTREVAGGNLDYAIPVKKHDQLGDLAVAFNSMTSSVRTMLAEVAAKERLTREVELAREIQSSLLPETEVRHGGLAVYAHFRPAAEVGGDYFDIFRLEGRRLLVTVGDVAGHGLPTGLLMAMLKSAVGALVQEGHRGVELVERVNRLLLEQHVKQRMATLAAADVDAARGEIEITSSGHPPAYLITDAGTVDEILLPSLPLGNHLPAHPAHWRGSFAAPAKLILYSDGFVEATAPDGTAFGYAGLRALLGAHGTLPAGELLRTLLRALDDHVEGKPLADDLTVVIVEFAGTVA